MTRTVTAGAAVALAALSIVGTAAAAQTTQSRRGYEPVVYQWGQYGGGNGAAPGGSPYGAGPVRRTPKAVRGIHGTVVQVATSNSDDYALTKSGVVYAWGAGRQGELGNGTTPEVTDTAVRVQLPKGVKIRSLSNPMPYDGGMAISTTGVVYAWGNDQNQQFCQPAAGILLRPVPVPLTDVKLADGALRHTIYYAHGKVMSCGYGPNGQLGNGTSGVDAQTGTPVTVQGLPHGRVAALESSWGDAGVLMANGDYYDWGYNASGQVGDGTTIEATTAVQVSIQARVKAIFQGGSFGNNGQTIALLQDGHILEWGNGKFGQLGNGTYRSSLIPMRLHSLNNRQIVSVASGGLTNYAVDARGQLWSWGSNSTGELGIGSGRNREARPVKVPVRVTQVSSTAHNTVALGRMP